MHDIKFIRKNPDAFDAALKRRGLAPQAAALLKLDEGARGDKTALQDLQTRMNTLAKKIGELKSKGENADAVIAESKDIKAKLAELKKQQEEGGDDATNSALDDALLGLPNLLAGDVPEGAGEQDNKEIRKAGAPPKFSFAPKDHAALGEALGMMDFEQTAKISGSRFVTLKGKLARLERALASFMLDVHTKEFGFEETSPPLLVREASVKGTGQLPKFEEDLFKTTDGRYLIPTSEVSLTNLVQDSIVEGSTLPRRYTAYTPCFRSEAGSAGKDTRGMIRLHQFNKVEMVSITRPEESDKEHERMTNCAEQILKRLGLAYRVMLLCSRDTGFSARKTYDLEVWLPGQNTYREISSCSNCGDFQARRMKARFKDGEGAAPQFVHTLNGSGLAVGRTLIAILENYQEADGSITIPPALVPYMDGEKKISR
jgi:seryl-tRNA synthetase